MQHAANPLIFVEHLWILFLFLSSSDLQVRLVKNVMFHLHQNEIMIKNAVSNPISTKMHDGQLSTNRITTSSFHKRNTDHLNQIWKKKFAPAF